MSIDNDKRELLKLKQGLIEESDIIKKEPPQKIKLHGKKKIENFFYHYKTTLLITLFFTFLIGFFVVETVTKKKSDLDFMVVASSADAVILSTAYDEEIQRSVESFCSDFDGNGYVYAQLYNIDLFNESDPNMLIAAQTRLFSEIQTGTTRLIMGNRDAFERIIGTEYKIEEVFFNLNEIFPGNTNISEDVFYKVKGSALLREADIDRYCPDDMYIAVLMLNLSGSSEKRAHEHTLEVLGNIVNSG